MPMPSSSVHAQRAPSSSSRLRKKFPEVYVLVPRSPYSLGNSGAIGNYSADSSHSPPTPLRAHNMSGAGYPFAIIKRKRSEGKLDDTEQHAPESKSKRRKVSAMTSKTQDSQKQASNATSEFPNGFFYCHQCNKKRDSSGEPALALIKHMATVLNHFPQLDCTVLIRSRPLLI
jgi:hypothetical protein